VCEDEVAGLIAQGQYALWSTGDLRTARAWFERAWTRADQQDRPEARAAAALGLGGLWVREHREDAAWANVLARQQRALEQPDLPPGLSAALKVRIAAELDFAEGAHARILGALEQARRTGDPDLLAFALSLAHHCLLGPEHAEQRVRLAEELLRTAAHSSRPSDALAGMLWLTVDQFLAGNPHAERSFTRLREAIRQQDHQAFGFVAAAVEVMLTIRDGRLERAEELARECAVLGERCGDADAATWYRGQLLTIRWFQGRVQELLPSLKEEVNSSALGPLDDSLLGALAVAATAAGDDLVAAGAVARLGRGDLDALPTSSVWLVTLYGAAEAAAQLQDVPLARKVHQLLAPHRDLPATASLAITCFGSVRQALGLAALTMGDAPAAIDHLRHAVQDNLALGHWPAHCLSLHRLATTLLLHGTAPERAEAAALLSTAEREATRFGMILPTHPFPAAGPSPSGPDPTEVRVGLLGPVEVAVNGAALSVPGERRRTVLAVLALHAGELVSAERLIDIVWGEEVPRTAANTLQSHISFLRRTLGASVPIVSHSRGYLLDIAREAVDVVLAEHLIGAEEALTPSAGTVGRLTRALSLWRGKPLDGVQEHPWVDDQAQRLRQLRLRGEKRLAQAHLLLRQPAQAVTLLTSARRENPLDEQLHQFLMLALYRQGLPSQALRIFEDLRAVLRDELGASPSGPLRELHTAILRQDAALDLP
jgi:DNA-binding SARP family transcriptional activator